MSTIVKDFKDIQDAVLEELKIQSGDTVTLARVKRLINQVYMQEVVPFTTWKWLSGHTKVIHKAVYAEGSSSVTPASATVTLDPAPNVSYGSFEGYYFATDGFSEVYVISSHTAGSATVTLTTEYQGNMSTTATFKIWRDTVNLPTNCKETSAVWHNYYTTPMDGLGSRDFRQMQLQNTRQEGPPKYYYTADFYDPTPLTDELEDDRYRQIKIHPSIYTKNVTINIDYIKEAEALIDDADEPIMPVEDRIVLVYGACARAWRSIARNEEASQLAKADYEAKLARMAGKVEDSQDTPRFSPSSLYVKARRAPRFNIGKMRDIAGGTGGGYTPISYLEDVTLKGGTITDDFTVTPGVTIDGVDISVLNSTVSTLTTDISDHLVDAVDAHDASAISFTPAGNLASTDIQAAVEELDDEKVTKAVSSTDNAVARFDGATGDLIQNSVVTIDDSGNTAGLLGLTMNGTFVNGLSTTTTLASVTLTDNTVSPTAAGIAVAATNTAVIIEYSLKRGSANIECGTLWMVNDGTSADVSGGTGYLGTLGVTFTADVNAGNVRLLYTTTSTGTNVTMRYTLKYWAA